MTLRAPFPWFGGKSRVAHLVWERFGDVPNYVEPFFGSGAVLLARPHWDTGRGCWRNEPFVRKETVNDVDARVSNFWRALAADPGGVAREADWPVHEADLAARHRWLRERHEGLRAEIYADATYFDVQAAGWWLWGLSASIATAWQRHSEQRPAAYGSGNSSQGNHVLPDPESVLRMLAVRMRDVWSLCGDWSRAVTPSRLKTSGKGVLTAVFLDPPYGTDERGECYAHDEEGVALDARQWAVANGDDPLLRIALCGYEGEYDMPRSWECVAWKATGGFGSRASARGRENAARERIWFSPHCINPAHHTPTFFDLAAVGGAR